MSDKKVKHYWTVLTKNVAVDQFTNNLVLGEVIEEIRYQIPASDKKKIESLIINGGSLILPFEGSLVSYMECEDANMNFPIRIECLLPNGEKSGIVDISMNFGSNKRARNITKIQGLKFVGPGRYIYSVIATNNEEDKSLTELPLIVNIDFI